VAQDEQIRKREPLGPGLGTETRGRMSDNFDKVTSTNAIEWDIPGHDGAVAKATVTGMGRKLHLYGLCLNLRWCLFKGMILPIAFK
jgi:hypothetical protein